MKFVLGSVITIAILIGALPSQAADNADDMNSASELSQALVILDGFIENGQADATVHELKGDVYALQGLSVRANAEYALAKTLSQAPWAHGLLSMDAAKR